MIKRPSSRYFFCTLSSLTHFSPSFSFVAVLFRAWHQKNCPISKNLTVFPALPFRRLHSNNLHCDCHLSWLSDWLRARRGLAPFTQCMAPANMRGLNVPDVPKKDFVCNGKVALTHLQKNTGLRHFWAQQIVWFCFFHLMFYWRYFFAHTCSSIRYANELQQSEANQGVSPRCETQSEKQAGSFELRFMAEFSVADRGDVSTLEGTTRGL